MKRTDLHGVCYGKMDIALVLRINFLQSQSHITTI